MTGTIGYLRLLLTGATGFFGSNLIDLLARSGDIGLADLEVHTVQRGPVDGPVDDRPAISHQLDLFDTEAVTGVLADIAPTHLCHLAWLGPEATDRYRSPMNDRWAEASKSLFAAFALAGGRRLVHLGSCIEYGNRASGPRSETQALDPDTVYGSAKAELSRHLLDDRRPELADVSVAVARPFFAFGPHEQPDRLVSSLILALDRGQPIDLTEGMQRRDYLDARDVAGALLALLGHDAQGAFNIGSGAAVTVRSIAETLGRLSGRPDLLRFGARPEGADTAAEIVADIGRITSIIGWSPTVELEAGLEHAMSWWRDRR